MTIMKTHNLTTEFILLEEAYYAGDCMSSIHKRRTELLQSF